MGNRAALNELLVLLRPIICRWSLVWSGDPDEAEDVAQEVMMRVHVAIRQFEPRAKTTTWVYRITRNVLHDRDRKSQRETDKLAKFQSVAEEAAHRVSEPLDRDRVMDTLATLMKELSPMQRSAIDLVDLQGFAAVDAAEMLGVEAATVRVHLLRGRQKLRTALRVTSQHGKPS